jgi:hypothetical protein
VPFLTIESAVDHIAGIAQGRRQLTVEIRVVFNDEQAHADFPSIYPGNIAAIQMRRGGVNDG